MIQSSQSTGSQPEQTNQASEVSDSSQIHGMTLKYSDDEITDEELQELNLQAAAQQYMLQQDAQQKVTPIPFQDSQSIQTPIQVDDHYISDVQNTQMSQVVHIQPAKLPNGSPGTQLQIPYLKEIFDTH